MPRGEVHGRAVLTADKVRLIRILYASGHGITLRQLGAMFGVGLSTIYHIIRRKTWTNVQ
jgi:transposase